MAFTVMRLGNEMRVNATGLDDQEKPSITALSDGRWVVTWDGFGPQGRGVYQQVYSGEGTPLFTNSSGQPMERRVNMLAPDGSDARQSSVEAFGDGWIVTWTQWVSGSREDIFVQRFDAEGRPLLMVDGQPADVRVNQTVAERQDNAQVTVLADGWIVTWLDPVRKGVYQQRFDASGQALYRDNGQAVDRRINDLSFDDIKGQDVAAIDGGSVVVWQQQFELGGSYHVMMQIVDANGNPTLDSDFRIAPGASNFITPPRVEALPDGDGFIVVWTAPDYNRTGVFLQKFDARGNAQFDEPLQVNTIEAGTQDEVSVEMLGDGGWVVTFSSGYDVYQRVYDEHGNPRGPESPIWANWLGSQWNQGSEAAALGDGRWVTAWTNWNQGSDAWMGISQRITTLSAVALLTPGDEFAFGTDESETLDVQANGLSAHDRVDGGGGNDTLRMIEAGTLDLRVPFQFGGIETLTGSSGADTIIVSAGRFGGIAAISSGDGHDELHLSYGGEYDLRNVAVSGIDRIALTDYATMVQVGDKATALMIHGEIEGALGDTVVFMEGTFSVTERYRLFKQGIEQVKDASGTYDKAAEAILYLNGDEVQGQPGGQVRLDAGQDAEVSTAAPYYSTLRVMISNRVKSQDQLVLLETDRIDINGTAVIVDGETIGHIAHDGTGPDGLVLTLNDKATATRVQTVIRSLAYENTATSSVVADPRKIAVALEDAGGSWTSVDVDVRFAMTNTAPQVVVRDTTPVRGADTSLVSPFANVWIRDSDTPSVTVTVTFDPAGGRLVLNSQSLGSYDPQSGTYTVTAHPELVSDDLKKLQFDPVDRSNPVGTMRATSFTIRVSDGNASDQDTVTVESVTANRAPGKPLLSGSNVQELTADGTAIGMVSGSDPNQNDTITYSLIGAEDAPFRLETYGGVTRLVVASGVKIDHEQRKDYTFTLRATDAQRLSNDTVVTIRVDDVDPESTAGSAANDIIKGGAGKDTLGGGLGNDMLWGGLGNDTLTGNGGKDIFVFATKTNKKTNVDKIADFVVKDDSIWLDNAVFTKIGKGSEDKPGKLAKAMFWTGKGAHDTSDRVIYDKASGALYYDADGTGRAAQVKIATLKKGLSLTEKDFFVI